MQYIGRVIGFRKKPAVFKDEIFSNFEVFFDIGSSLSNMQMRIVKFKITDN